MHVGGDGIVWTGEADRIAERSPKGRVVRGFNAAYFQGAAAQEKGVSIPIFSLAGDRLVVLGVYASCTVKLEKAVVSANSSIVT